MDVMIKLTREETNSLQYQVVVEMWKHKDCGIKNRKAWTETFTEEERTKAAEWYKIFYGWYIFTGVSRPVIDPHTYLWLQNKLIPFFGTL